MTDFASRVSNFRMDFPLIATEVDRMTARLKDGSTGMLSANATLVGYATELPSKLNESSHTNVEGGRKNRQDDLVHEIVARNDCFFAGVFRCFQVGSR